MFFKIYFAFKNSNAWVTLLILFLLINHESLFNHMLRSPKRVHRKTYYINTYKQSTESTDRRRHNLGRNKTNMNLRFFQIPRYIRFGA